MVSKHFYPFLGGLETRVLEIARWLVSIDEEAIVLTSYEVGTESKETVDGIDVHRSQVLASPFNAIIAPGILWDLFKLDYDVIDINLPDPANAIWTLLASFFRRKPVIVTYHADIVKFGGLARIFKMLFSPIESALLSRASSILVTSSHYSKGSKTLTPHMNKVVVTPSFIDLKRFNQNVDTSKFKGSIPNGSKPVLFVGRLVPYKGVDRLISAFAKLKEEGAVLVIVGTGPLDADLRKHAKALRIEERVIFAQDVSENDLAGYYAGSHVFALPSVTRQEAFGLVLVESMACGTPAVSCDFSGMPYVIGDEMAEEIDPGIKKGTGGLLIPPDDVHALAKALEMILVDDELRNELSKGGLSRVGDLFTKEVVCKKVMDAYISASTK